MIKIGVITIVLVSYLHAGWFSGWFDPTPSFSVDMDLGKTGYTAEKKFKINQDKSYVIGLSYRTTYEKEQEDNYKERNKVTKVLFGEYRTTKGWVNVDRTPIPIKVTITKIDKPRKAFSFEKIYFTDKGKQYSYKDMNLDFIELVEGSYKIKVEILEGVSELKGIPISIKVKNIRKIK